ncbi:hypothetical protein Q6D67_01015 [Haliea sp. E1-2-M8]|uniref:hypothetical protein n=1 Tax=Haliea sp. E1-2-M8 TaxID=3064706 RepID=UPI00271BA818|nr:hypothetical protein [Haliea sp. E1-2-M8]MDO8860265.1 hypothetical protein [Haliea sp. E1-2-M8]
MVFSFTLKARSGRVARIIAVLALLCLTGVQALEASHAHGLGDAPAECLLCKTSAPLPLASALPPLVLSLLLALLLPVPLAARACNRYLPRQTTGPPAHS